MAVHDLDSPMAFKTPPSGLDCIMLPNMGLYTEENTPGPKLHKRSLEEIAKHADYVCRGSLEEPWFIEQIIEMKDIKEFTGLNSTAFGNMAYSAIHSQNEEAKSTSITVIERWRHIENSRPMGKLSPEIIIVPFVLIASIAVAIYILNR